MGHVRLYFVGASRPRARIRKVGRTSAIGAAEAGPRRAARCSLCFGTTPQGLPGRGAVGTSSATATSACTAVSAPPSGRLDTVRTKVVRAGWRPSFRSRTARPSGGDGAVRGTR